MINHWNYNSARLRLLFSKKLAAQSEDLHGEGGENNLKIPRHVLEIRKRWYSSSFIGLKTRKGRGRTNEYSLDNKLVSVLVRRRLLFAISQLMIVTWSTIYYISPLPPFFCSTTMPTDYTQWAERGRSACDINLCRDPFIAVTISQNLIPIWIN